MREENLHITLKFLGGIEGALEDRLSSDCAEVAAGVSAGAVSISGLGAFPRPARATVLWAGVSDPSEVLTRLAEALDGSAAAYGVLREERAFTPHITLARFRRPVKLGGLPDLRPGAPWRVETVGLFSSTPGAGAPIYRRRAAFHLAT